VEKVKASPAILFLAQYFPPFWGFVCAGIAIAVVAGLHLVMAIIMEHNIVVFEKAECVATYEVDTSIGYVACGEYTTHIDSTLTLTFVNNIKFLGKKPYCSVTKGTYTEDLDFDCSYHKSTEDWINEG